MATEAMALQLETRLLKRIAQQIELEGSTTCPAKLLDFIDPMLRKRTQEGENEPAAMLDRLREFLSTVESASMLSAKVVKFATDGGSSRAHRPTAIVETAVRYNDDREPVHFKTPWVLDSDEWYTRALGKFKPKFGTPRK